MSDELIRVKRALADLVTAVDDLGSNGSLALSVQKAGRAMRGMPDPKRAAAARKAWSNRTPKERADWKKAIKRGRGI